MTPYRSLSAALSSLLLSRGLRLPAASKIYTNRRSSVSEQYSSWCDDGGNIQTLIWSTLYSPHACAINHWLASIAAALALHLCTHLHLPTSSSLRNTDRSFQYASPRLWNQLPASLRQPHTNICNYDSPSFLSGTFGHSAILRLPLLPMVGGNAFRAV